MLRGLQNVIEELKRLSIALPLEDYNWEIPNNCPIAIPSSIEDNYSRNIYLKENFGKHLKADKKLDSHYWIVREWGGIGSFKINEKNNGIIIDLERQLKSNQLKRETFNSISSLSKIASFMQPENYAIYDSRAIYSLNWLIFCLSEQKYLFPQPTGRGSEIAKYDMQTIIRLSNNGHDYKSYKIAYHDYCSLLKLLCTEIYGDDKIYKVEMLLFRAAPEKIVDSIRLSVAVDINYQST